ncbi:MAG: resolvase, partial [Proteobacteria bacterium]|nr:resolvase [Pseudomonadota bacterium]
VATRLDRLARSTRDLLDLAESLNRAGVGLRSLAEPWADTTSPAGKMVLTVFAGIAEFERSLGSPHPTEKSVRLFESSHFHCSVFRSGLNCPAATWRLRFQT